MSEQSLSYPTTFETNVPGIYSAGVFDKGSTIAQALLLGYKSVDEINEVIDKNAVEDYDLIIVGSGPAGITAAVRAKELGLKYIVLEQNRILESIRNFPKEKIVEVNYGNKDWSGTKFPIWFEDCPHDVFINSCLKAVEDNNLKVHMFERVTAIDKNEQVFEVKTEKSTYNTLKVLLCIGKFGFPRRLGIEGEEEHYIFHSFKDVKPFENKKILVVGGGNTAAEAALIMSRHSDVTISYRRDSFVRLSEMNTKEMADEIKEGKIKTVFSSKLEKIENHMAYLAVNDKTLELDVDYVFILIGFQPPQKFLDKLGIIGYKDII